MKRLLDRVGLSIVVATYNRSKLIKNLITYFDKEISFRCALDIELLIINNNSTDDTKDVIEKAKLAERDYEVNCVTEKNQGLSFARNKGISIAKHDWMLFLDDDALPSPDFFNNLLPHLKKNRSVSAFCCKVITHYRYIPSWFSANGPYQLPMMGTYDLGNRSRFLNLNDPPPIGSASILRKNIFQKYGYFDIRFGYNRRSKILIPGEDTRLTSTILKEGEPIYYVHNCLINHHPPSNKLDIRTLSKIYLGQGFLFGVEDREKCDCNVGLRISGIPAWYHKELASTLARSLYCGLSGNRTGFYYYYLYFLKIIGRYYGYIRA